MKATEEAITTLDLSKSVSPGKGQRESGVLLEHSYDLLFTYCLWLLSSYNTRGEQIENIYYLALYGKVFVDSFSLKVSYVYIFLWQK